MANFHQFLLTGESREFEDLRLPVDGALVSAESSQVVVRTGAYAAPVEVGLELLRLEPSEPDSIWEDVVELSVLSADRIALAELMEAPKGAIATEAGWYRLRIAARGRDAGEERGEVGQRAKVLEHYLVQAWAAPAAPGTTIRATSLRPVDHALRRTYLAGARAAADRINADLDRSPGHRALSRATGSVSVEWAYRATRRKLFLPMAFLNYWTSASSSSSGNTVEVGAQYSLSNNEDRDIFDGIPTSSRGHVLATLVEVDRPNFVVTRWQWLGFALLRTGTADSRPRDRPQDPPRTRLWAPAGGPKPPFTSNTTDFPLSGSKTCGRSGFASSNPVTPSIRSRDSDVAAGRRKDRSRRRLESARPADVIGSLPRCKRCVAS